MWFLLILSMTQGELKYTAVDSYDTVEECHLALFDTYFEDYQEAICLKSYHNDE
jgi:hypothetical protein|tara:strand:+ start:731 stop:892 length:162 start_codon:yes stop_codon:yes gene_type:complete